MNEGAFHFIITKGPRAGEQIALSNLPLTIGRVEPADFIIEERSVSRNHLRVSLAEHGLVIEDLGSSNGTFVNSERIHGTRLLKNGDRVSLGTEVELLLAAAPVEFGETMVVGKTDVQRRTVSQDRIPFPSLPSRQALQFLHNSS